MGDYTVITTPDEIKDPVLKRMYNAIANHYTPEEFGKVLYGEFKNEEFWTTELILQDPQPGQSYLEIYIIHDITNDKVDIRITEGWGDPFPIEQLEIIDTEESRKLLDKFRKFKTELHKYMTPKYNFGNWRRRIGAYPELRDVIDYDDVANELNHKLLVITRWASFKKQPTLPEIEWMFHPAWIELLDEMFLDTITEYEELTIDGTEIVTREWGKA